MHNEIKQHGMFSWNELLTPDVAAAKTFYAELLGWTLQDIHPGDMDYTIIKSNNREIGGIMATPPQAKGMPPMWGGYVTVDDVDKLATRVDKLGGQVVIPPRDIPNVGRFCVLQDPQGAMLSLITYQACA
jgi:uncharacterized protein